MNFDSFIKNIYQNLFNGESDDRILEDVTLTQSQIKNLQSKLQAQDNSQFDSNNPDEIQELNYKMMVLQQQSDQLGLLKKVQEQINSKVKPVLLKELTNIKDQQQYYLQERLEVLSYKLYHEQSISILDAQLDNLKNDQIKIGLALEQNKLNSTLDQSYLDNLQVQSNDIDIQVQKLKDNKTELDKQLQDYNEEKLKIFNKQQDLEQKLMNLQLQKQQISNLKDQTELNIGQQNQNQLSHLQTTQRDLESKKANLAKEFQELQDNINKNQQDVENINLQHSIINVEIAKLTKSQNHNDEKYAIFLDSYDKISSDLKSLNQDLNQQEQELQFVDEQKYNNNNEESDTILKIRILQKSQQEIKIIQI